MKICIDAGHGGRDPGAVGPSGLREKHPTLLFSYLLRSYLEGSHAVVLTRYSDKFLEISERAHYANKEHANLFISIHFNSATSSTAHGVETFHFPGSVMGKYWAGNIQQALVQSTGLRDRGTKEENFGVLRQTHMPAVLLEIGFLSNPEEEKLIGNVDWLVRVAKNVAKRIKENVQKERGKF